MLGYRCREITVHICYTVLMNTQQEIIKGNKLIAKFTGCEMKPNRAVKSDEYGIVWGKLFENLEYHSSWEELMPIIHRAWDLTTEDEREFKGLVLFELGLFTPIEEVWEALVDFIKWYNLNHETKERN